MVDNAPIRWLPVPFQTPHNAACSELLDNFRIATTRARKGGLLDNDRCDRNRFPQRSAQPGLFAVFRSLINFCELGHGEMKFQYDGTLTLRSGRDVPRALSDLIPGSLLFIIFGSWLGRVEALNGITFASALTTMGLLLFVAVSLPYLLSRRTTRIFLPLLFATFLRTMGRIIPLFNAGLIICLLTVPDIFPKLNHFQLWDLTLPERRLGTGLSAFYCITYFVELSSSLGLPPGLTWQPRIESLGYLKMYGRILGYLAGMLAAVVPNVVFLAVIVLVFTILYYAGLIHVTIKNAAKVFDTYPTIAGVTPPKLGRSIPRAFHISDVHVTPRGEKRLEGGSGGAERLRILEKSGMIQSSSMLFVTGDLTDRGSPAEYEEAFAALKPLREAGSRIFLAPGNHDLGTAYGATNHLIVMSQQKYIGPGSHGTDGLLMLRYLEATASLEPDMKDCTGCPLSERLERYRENEALFERALARARRQMLTLRFNSRARADFNAEGEKYYPGRGPKSGWTRFLVQPSAFRKLFLGSWYAGKWYDPFPLESTIDDGSTSIFVLNSISPDVTIGGSAWGELGKEQLARLQTIIRNKLSKLQCTRLIILVHHPPFRWKDDVPPRFTFADLQRWAFLGLAHEDMRTLLDILKHATNAGRQVLVLCGHRHGFKAEDGSHVCRSGKLGKIVVAEGASLADSSSSLIAIESIRNRFEVRSFVLE